jgi:hypothetical protein
VKVKLGTAGIGGEPDSFKRQHEALLRLARSLKRVPALSEAMEFIHVHNLFTGTWDDNLDRRTARVMYILKLIGQTFDASKCGSGAVPIQVNVGKYDAWAAQRFPNGILGDKRCDLTEYGEVVERKHREQVDHEFVAVFLAVCEFTLSVDKNDDDRFPQSRAEAIWKRLYASGTISINFNDRKWAVCRDALDAMGVINVIDRSYSPGKAMKWLLGKYFPFLGLWKNQHKPSSPLSWAALLTGLRHLQAGLEPESLSVLLARFKKKKEEKKEEPNSLLYQQCPKWPQLVRFGAARPPPTSSLPLDHTSST